MSISSILLFTVIGLTIYKNDGFVDRLTENEKIIFAFKGYDRKIHYREGACFLEPNQTIDLLSEEECLGGDSLIWGDSHAAAISFGLRKIGNFSQISASGCPPILNETFVSRPYCVGLNKAIGFCKKELFNEIYLHAN